MNILCLSCILFYWIVNIGNVKAKDSFYIISIKKDDSSNEDTLYNTMSSILGVIKTNVNTYDNSEYVNDEISKLENTNEILSVNNINGSIIKRDNMQKTGYNSNLVFPILKVDTLDILLGYLNDEIVDNIKDIDEVENCVKDIEMGERIIEPNETEYKKLCF
eukprot:jgi/Orpsp1_1/1183258/evm.model.c7180000084470.2